MIILLTIVVISPYLTRNIMLVDKIIVTQSIGYNLWKGNNPNSLVEGSVIHNKDLEIKIQNVLQDKYYSLNVDKIYFDEALKNINTIKLNNIGKLKKSKSFLLVNLSTKNPEKNKVTTVRTA